MKNAIIVTGGKQYRVSEGDEIFVTGRAGVCCSDDACLERLKYRDSATDSIFSDFQHIGVVLDVLIGLVEGFDAFAHSLGNAPLRGIVLRATDAETSGHSLHSLVGTGIVGRE